MKRQGEKSLTEDKEDNRKSRGNQNQNPKVGGKAGKSRGRGKQRGKEREVDGDMDGCGGRSTTTGRVNASREWEEGGLGGGACF
jgi:hypothetical protein